MKLEKGIIVPWEGSKTDVPEGWSLCDGTDGTPNLAEMFLLGTTEEDEINKSTGNDFTLLNIENLPKHDHLKGGKVTESAGEHTHDLYCPSYLFSNEDWGSANGGGSHNLAADAKHSEDDAVYVPYVLMKQTDDEGIHSHGYSSYRLDLGNNFKGKGKPIDIKPMYYELAFIIKDFGEDCEFPSGVIIPFYDDSDKIPEGWNLCDGSNNTPDLRDRYLRGNNVTSVLYGMYGDNDIVYLEDSLPKHLHSIQIGDDGVHNHGTSKLYNGSQSAHFRFAVRSWGSATNDHEKNFVSPGVKSTELTNAKYTKCSTHYHQFTLDGEKALGEGAPLSFSPSYVSMYFIKKN